LKDNDIADNLLLKDRKKEKRNNEQPTHDQNLQKKLFFAEVPPKFDTFVILNITY